MDLTFNTNPEFTKWVVSRGLLQEDFVVVDVGVLGGENPRWHFLGDRLIVHGFDATKEAIDELNAGNKHANRRKYHWLAIGNEDGEKEFFVTPADPTQSSFYRPGASRMADGRLSYESRRVPVRSLDSLLAAGAIPAPDFLKVDVEGFEKFVFLGASKCLSQQLIGIETETNFNTSAFYPNTHIGTLQDCALPHGFLMFDLNFDRVPRATFQNARTASGMPARVDSALGRPATFNVLFCRDLVAEADGTQFHTPQRAPPHADQIIKAMIIYELHGLNDVAFDTAVRFSAELGTRLDVDKACRLLLESGARPATSPGPAASLEAAAASQDERTPLAAGDLARKSDELQKRIDELTASTSWKITAPLRWLKKRILR